MVTRKIQSVHSTRNEVADDGNTEGCGPVCSVDPKPFVYGFESTASLSLLNLGNL